MLIEITKDNKNNNKNLLLNAIFNLKIKLANQFVGKLTVYEHPDDKKGGQVHIEILKKWRSRWVSKTLRNILIPKLKEEAKKHNLSTLYSTALTDVSPRLLAFGGFIEYNKTMPKTYYYLFVN